MELGIAYSIVAAFVWGTYLFVLKRYFDGYPATVLSVLVYPFAIALYAPFVALTLPDGAMAAASPVSLKTIGIVVGTVVMVAIALIASLRALDEGDVSYVAPISKLVPVFVLPLEVGFLHAHLGPLEVAGVGVATLAVYVANYEPGSLLAPIRRAATSRPAQLALLSAAAFGVSDIGKRLALEALPTKVWVLAEFVGVFLVLLPFAIRDWPGAGGAPGVGVDLRADLPKLVGTGALVAVGEHLSSSAFNLTLASIASPVINTQAVIAVLLGGLLLGEEAFRVRLAAAGLAVVGVTLIAV